MAPSVTGKSPHGSRAGLRTQAGCGALYARHWNLPTPPNAPVVARQGTWHGTGVGNALEAWGGAARTGPLQRARCTRCAKAGWTTGASRSGSSCGPIPCSGRVRPRFCRHSQEGGGQPTHGSLSLSGNPDTPRPRGMLCACPRGNPRRDRPARRKTGKAPVELQPDARSRGGAIVHRYPSLSATILTTAGRFLRTNRSFTQMIGSDCAWGSSLSALSVGIFMAMGEARVLFHEG